MSDHGASRDRTLGAVTILTGERGGRYPHGNSMMVAGAEETLLVDPSLSLIARDSLPFTDRVLNSHCHEDHVAGNHLYPKAPLLLHEADLPGMRSLDDMMAIYGMSPRIAAAFREILVDDFHYVPRPDATAIRDGDVLDLGGTRVRVIHAPGHTRGHCVLHVEPEDVVYLGDIDLSSFGPYYGDASSSLADFRRSLRKLAELPARVWITSHHKGVITDRAAFAALLAAFGGRIDEREARLLRMLDAGPRTLAELARERLLYPPHASDVWTGSAEARSIEQHLAELLADVGKIDARWYATFHHVGVVEGREAFDERLDRFAAVIGARETRLVAFLAEPRTIDEIVAHRFVYRPGDAVPFADDVERRSMTQHLDRLLAAGRVEEVEPGRYRVK